MNDSRNITVGLLQFQSQIQGAFNEREVAFTAVNESLSLLEFDQAVVWKYDIFNRPIITAASGLADIGAESPYVQWLERAIRSFPRDSGTVRPVRLVDLPEHIIEEGSEWCHENLLVCDLKGPDGTDRGGMLFSRAKPFAEADTAVAEWIARTTGYGLWAWRAEGRRVWRWLSRRSTIELAILTFLIGVVLVLVPVQLNVLAASEITPQKPIPVTSPVEGVVSRIVIQPNQIVKAGEVLAVLDDTLLRNRLAVAQKALEIAKADSQRAINKAFSDENSRTELQVLLARAREKSAEVNYVSEMLQRLTIHAPQGGVAIFSNPDDWTGKPVQPGERIMVIADPSLIRVTIYVPPEDAVQLEPDAEVKVFLNTDPLNPRAARVTQASYEALAQADGTLAYVVQAELLEGHGFPRIGLRGTAKIYAEQVSLAYYLFRKPLSFVRKNLGL